MHATVWRYERWLVAAAALLGALRVAVFALGFPPFNPVDELGHFDLVVSYSRGEWPQAVVRSLQPLSAELRVLYGSPEYRSAPADDPEDPHPTPPGAMAGIRDDPLFPHLLHQAEQMPNYEVGTMPVYYLVAGAWTATGRALGIDGIALFFWVRLLNVPIFLVLVWLTYRIAVLFFPGSLVLRAGIPIAAAWFPQSLVYGVSSDTFLAPAAAATFYLVSVLRHQPRSLLFHVLTGLAAAATVLVKANNGVVVATLLGWLALHRLRGGWSDRRALSALLVLLVAAAAPVALWFVYCHLVLGDWTGVAEKFRHLDWTVKPVAEWFDHPLFTVSGLAGFLAELTRTGWRGEFVWHAARIHSPIMDVFYLASTGVFLSVAAASAIADGRHAAGTREVTLLSFTLLATSVLFLAWLSMRYDFGTCWYPSREEPFLNHGRLMFGAFVPFALLYVRGFDAALSRVASPPTRLALLGGLFGVITIGDVALNAPVLQSQFNWFHLP